MPASSIPIRTLNELDHVRLQSLLRRHPAASAPGAAPLLETIIDNADLLPPQQIPPDTVTMHSRVRLVDGSGLQQTLTLCYPQDADPDKRFVSVLSPIGTSLLGQRVGATVSWTGPDGTPGSMQLQAIEYQPEANGELLK